MCVCAEKRCFQQAQERWSDSLGTHSGVGSEVKGVEAEVTGLAVRVGEHVGGGDGEPGASRPKRISKACLFVLLGRAFCAFTAHNTS